jgi:hypothetical protein
VADLAKLARADRDDGQAGRDVDDEDPAPARGDEQAAERGPAAAATPPIAAQAPIAM